MKGELEKEIFQLLFDLIGLLIILVNLDRFYPSVIRK